MLLAALAERQDRTQQQLDQTQQLVEETRAIADSNARAIEASISQQALRRDIQQFSIDKTAEQSAENNESIDILISESRQNMIQHQAFDRKFEQVMSEIRLRAEAADRRFDQALAEIRAIWQRIAS